MRRVCVALALVACGHHLPTATISVDGHPVRVEVAANDEDRAHGLMERTSLGADEGMLFVYKEAKPRSFWMKNTPLPLSIAYADSEGKIVKILDMQPFSTERVQSVYPARYALEMNQGWFAANDVTAGDLLSDLPDVQAQ